MKMVFHHLSCYFASFLLGMALGASPKKPNIVILMADDLGIGDVGLFGNTSLRTPNIDSIGQQGIKFTQMLAASSVCSPSRAAFLTGRYPIRSGMAGLPRIPVVIYGATPLGLPEEEVTFAELAKQAGYTTGLVGKWHLGLSRDTYGDYKHHPLNQGFDFFYGVPLTLLRDFDDTEEPYWISLHPNRSTHFRLSYIMGLLFLVLLRHTVGVKGIIWFFLILALITMVFCMETMIQVLTRFKLWNSLLFRNYDLVEQPIRLEGLTKRLVQEGEEFIERHYLRKEPFLLFMSWLQTHSPMHAGPRFSGKSMHGKYGDEVEELDWSVGQILQALKRRGLENNTLVIFTSDQGGHVEEIGRLGNREGGYNGIYRGGKMQGAMDGGLRTPTMVKWPGKITPNSINHELFSLMDFAPTLANLLGVPMPQDKFIDGKDITAALTGKQTQSPHEFLFHYCTDILQAVRWNPNDGDSVWKVRYASPVWHPGTEGCGFMCSCTGKDVMWHETPLLFDVTVDPAESQPIPRSDPRYQKIMGAINNGVAKHNETLKDCPHVSFWDYFLIRFHLQPCCNFPYCACKESKYTDSNLKL